MLFKHQEEGIQFLGVAKKAILADSMGLGKTRQAIIAAGNTKESVLVVCPASLKENWAREIRAAEQPGDILIVDGSKTYTYYEEDYPDGATECVEWLIVNYDVLDRYKPEDLERFNVAILDEAHYIKNASTNRTKAALEIVAKMEYVYLLTGTPVLNRPEELYTLLKAIGHQLGKSWFKYIMRYCNATKREFLRWVTLPNGARERKLVSFWDTNGASNLDELAVKISDSYLRRTKDELGDKIPAKIVDTIKIDLSPEYRDKYQSAWQVYMDYLKNDPEGINKTKIINAQMARHLIELGKLKQVASLSKLDRMTEDIVGIVEQGEKVLVFSQYTKTIEQLKDRLAPKKIKVVTLTGSDDMTARQKAVDAIQDGDATVFIGNIQAAGVGLTLTAANTVLFADMAWTPALNEQAEDRAHRIGQHKQVNVHYYLAKQTVDEDIAELLGVKREIIAKILSGQSGSSKDITADLIRRIVEKNRTQVIH